MIKRTIKSEITALANKLKDKMSEKQIYTSPQMLKYLNGLAGTLCRGKCKPPKLCIIDDGADGITAKTDGEVVTVNFSNALIGFFKTLIDRFMSFLGMFYHEIAHVLYNDFDETAKALNRIESGKLYGKMPEAETPEEADYLVEMLDAVADPKYTELFLTLFHELDNTVIDPHDEGKIIEEFGGIAREAIFKTREALRAESSSVEEVEALVSNGKMPKFEAVCTLMFEYLRFCRVLCFSDEVRKNSEIYRTLQKIASVAELARWTDDTEEKFTCLNKIVFSMWPYIHEVLNQPEQDGDGDGDGNGNGSSQSGNSSDGNGNQSQPNSGNQQQGSGSSQNSQSNGQQQPTAEQIAEIVQQIQSAAQNTPGTAAPSGRSSKTAKVNRIAAQQGKQNPPQQSEQASASVAGGSGDEESGDDGSAAIAQSAIANALGTIITGIATEEAENQIEQTVKQELNHDAVLALDGSSSHKGIPVILKRDLKVYDDDIERYEEMMKDLKPYVRRLIQKMQEIMKDFQRGGLNRHKAYGKIVCVQDAYRPDELMFANKKAPVDLPNMAVCVLVDNSGSMWGDRIDLSARAATLLHEFCTGIGIPVAVAGHTTSGGSVKYNVYTDYDQYSDKDKYRIAKMEAENCNRDGAAIEIAASRLAERPEALKLLIVISDGMPNHDGYGGESAKKDIKSIVAKYRRKGIEVVGAAIGDDRETISSIYGDGFLDISDLDKFPKTLVKLVQKRLMEQII